MIVNSANACTSNNLKANVSLHLREGHSSSPREDRINEIAEIEKVIGHKLNGAEFKGKNVCPCCRTKMNRCLEDLPSDFDWENGFRERFKIPECLICNQCAYHIMLLLIVGLKKDKPINVINFVKAYTATMNLEDVFFDPLDLSCSTLSESDTFQTLERRDDIQSLYCQTFNNAYDLVNSGGAKSYFQPDNWLKVLTYKRGRFYELFTKERLWLATMKQR